MIFVKASLRIAFAVVALSVMAACSSVQETGPGGSRISESIATQPGPGNVEKGTQQDLVVNVGDRVFFQTDSASLTAQARDTLKKQAAWLKMYPARSVTIEGHCDERGTRDYNLALGARRANAVRDYLVSLGTESSRVRTISYGKERPVALCGNDQCWSQNRRSVTVVNDSGVGS